MNAITTREVSTKSDARAEAVTTKLTLNWEGMAPEEIRALAEQALVVKLQGKWRKDGIPAEAEVKVVEHKVGVRSPKAPVDIFAAINSMTPEQKAALLAKLTG